VTQPASQPDGSAPLIRRDLLRLGADSLGLPLLASSTVSLAAVDRPAQVNAEATPLSDSPAWEDDDYPDHPDPPCQDHQRPQVHALVWQKSGMGYLELMRAIPTNVGMCAFSAFMPCTSVAERVRRN
jgi:hypothetical protein